MQTTLDPATQPFLDHHRIDGTPVLPGVMGIEAFAEAARVLVPGWYVVGVENVEFRAPVKFYRDEPRTLTVTALLRPDGADLVAECRLTAERPLPGTDRPSARSTSPGRYGLADPPPRRNTTTPRSPKTPDAADARTRSTGCTSTVRRTRWSARPGRTPTGGGPLRRRPAARQADSPTLTGPRLVELCFQAAGLWEAGREGRLALPRARRRGAAVRRTGRGRGPGRDRAARWPRRLRLRRAGRRGRGRAAGRGLPHGAVAAHPLPTHGTSWLMVRHVPGGQSLHR